MRAIKRRKRRKRRKRKLISYTNLYKPMNSYQAYLKFRRELMAFLNTAYNSRLRMLCNTLGFRLQSYTRENMIAACAKALRDLWREHYDTARRANALHARYTKPILTLNELIERYNLIL